MRRPRSMTAQLTETAPSEPVAQSPAAAPEQQGLKTLLVLAWPIVVSRSTQVVVGLCDALLVADLGQAALAATTTGAFNTFAILILPMGCTFIVSSFASQLAGQGDVAGARRYGFYGLGVAVIAQGLCGLGAFGVAPILAFTDYTPEVQKLMTDYMVIRLWSGGAAMGLEALANYYGGLGNTHRPMLASVAAMVLNVAGCFVFIPSMGVRGAALAAAVATVLAFVGLLASFLYEGRALGRIVPKLQASEFLRMLKFGLPSGFNWFFEFFAFNFFINVVIAGLGTTAVAAMMSVFQINSISFMPAFALASAGSILVGQAIGAKKPDAVPRLVRLTFTSSAAWQLTVSLAYVFIPGLLIAPFAKGEGKALFIEVGVRMLMLSAAWQLFDAAVNSVAESLRAAGDTAFTLWARLAVAWLVFVPGSWLTVRRFGGGDVHTVAWVVGYMALLALILFFRFRSGAWRKIQLVEGAPAPH